MFDKFLIYSDLNAIGAEGERSGRSTRTGLADQ